MFRITALYKRPRPRQMWIGGKFVQNPDANQVKLAESGKSDTASVKSSQAVEESKNEEAWVELFIDLVYVALLYKLGNLVEICYGQSYIFGRVFILFWCLFITRMAIDEYANRFYSDDLLHKLMYLVYTAGVFVQVMNINASGESGLHATTCEYVSDFGSGIFIGIFITRASIIASKCIFFVVLLITAVILISSVDVVHIMVMFHNPLATKQFFFDIIRWTISLVITILGIIIHSIKISSEISDFAMLALIIFLETCIWLYSRSMHRKNYTYPIDLELLQSRWGVWVMIVIGESIIQMLIVSPTISHLSTDYQMNLLALLLMFSLAMQYYDACQRQWYDHAITQSAIAGVLWIWLHPLMTFFLFGVGVALKMLSHEGEHAPAVQILSSCCGIVTFLLSIMRLTHTNFRFPNNGSFLIFLARLFLSMFQISVQWFFGKHISPTNVIMAQSIICVVGFNFLDIYYDLFFALSEDDDRFTKIQKKSRPWSSLPLVKSMVQWKITASSRFQFLSSRFSVDSESNQKALEMKNAEFQKKKAERELNSNPSLSNGAKSDEEERKLSSQRSLSSSTRIHPWLGDGKLPGQEEQKRTESDDLENGHSNQAVLSQENLAMSSNVAWQSPTKKPTEQIALADTAQPFHPQRVLSSSSTNSHGIDSNASLIVPGHSIPRDSSDENHYLQHQSSSSSSPSGKMVFLKRNSQREQSFRRIASRKSIPLYDIAQEQMYISNINNDRSRSGSDGQCPSVEEEVV